ncbi:stalk domain-containing protein [Paenibacillus antibioticophila]|uniref:stalk domain-containing protein n=1 Tax=Paenibacillus antibioticophila TaxID=1274374 RepID=UPI0005C97008|nr:stalk domain-containing protein [Paenibacillus antibioticophila]
MKKKSKVHSKGRMLLTGMLSLALLAGGGTASFAETAANAAEAGSQTTIKQGSLQTIVAIGDSITAGYEPGMTEASAVYGYVDRIKEQALFHNRTEVTNYGILGLTSTGLLNYLKAIQEGVAVTADTIQPEISDPRISVFASGIPETRTKLAQADTILITIGGNDVSQLIEQSKSLSAEQLETTAYELLTVYKTNIQEILSVLTVISPDAQIILADQYQPVPKIAGESQYVMLSEIAAGFTQAVDEAVAALVQEGKSVKASHVAERFVGKELAYTHIFNEDVHPNQSGYETIAKVMAESIWGYYRITEAQKGKTELSVVVSGAELQTPYKPIVKNSQTFIVLRDITDAIGGTSKWDSKSSTATVSYNGSEVVIPIGAKTVTANGISLETASPAFLQKVGTEQKTYVPLALLVKGLGLDVQYSSKMKTVFINL